MGRREVGKQRLFRAHGGVEPLRGETVGARLPIEHQLEQLGEGRDAGVAVLRLRPVRRQQVDAESSAAICSPSKRHLVGIAVRERAHGVENGERGRRLLELSPDPLQGQRAQAFAVEQERRAALVVDDSVAGEIEEHRLDRLVHVREHVLDAFGETALRGEDVHVEAGVLLRQSLSEQVELRATLVSGASSLFWG